MVDRLGSNQAPCYVVAQLVIHGLRNRDIIFQLARSWCFSAHCLSEQRTVVADKRDERRVSPDNVLEVPE